MHKCPKRCLFHGMFGESNALNSVLCCQRNFKCSPYSNSAIKLSIQPSQLMKNMQTSAPSLVPVISMRKCFNAKLLLWGAPTLTWQQEKHAKLCASLIIFYPVGMGVQTDATKHHQPDPWPTGSMPSAIANAISTLWPSLLPTSDIHLSELCLFIHHKLPYGQR